MNDKITPIMLIGSMKSGTTTLYNYLIQHPEIAEGIIKEPEYFSINMGNPHLKNGSYESLFKVDFEQHKFTLDASTGYTKYPVEKGVPKRIKDYGIKPYFIYIVRNPFDRIRSHFNFMKKDLSWENSIIDSHLINTSKYYTQIQEYVKIFPDSRILILDFDRLKNDPVGLCDQIFNFIGTKKFKIIRKENSIKNKTKPVNRNQLTVKKKLSRYGGFIPTFLKTSLNKILDLILPPRQKQLTIKQKSIIKQQLSEDMNYLKSSYGIDVSNWGF